MKFSCLHPHSSFSPIPFPPLSLLFIPLVLLPLDLNISTIQTQYYEKVYFRTKRENILEGIC